MFVIALVHAVDHELSALVLVFHLLESSHFIPIWLIAREEMYKHALNPTQKSEKRTMKPGPHYT